MRVRGPPRRTRSAGAFERRRPAPARIEDIGRRHWGAGCAEMAAVLRAPKTPVAPAPPMSAPPDAAPAPRSVAGHPGVDAAGRLAATHGRPPSGPMTPGRRKISPSYLAGPVGHHPRRWPGGFARRIFAASATRPRW